MGDDIYEYYFKEQSYEAHKEPHYITQQYIKHLEKKCAEQEAEIAELKKAVRGE